MNYLSQILLTLIVPLGITAGFIVSKNAEEELEDGKLYFRIAHALTFFFVGAFFIYLTFKNPILSSFLPTLIIFSIIYLDKKYRLYTYSIIMGLILGYSLLKIDNYAFYGLAFFFMTLQGTLIFIEAKKNKISEMKHGAINAGIVFIISLAFVLTTQFF